MNKVFKAFFVAFFYFIFLIGLPFLAMNIIPIELQQYFNSTAQVSFQVLMQAVIFIGFILIILSVVKNLTEKNDLKHLIVSIAMILIGLYLTLFFFGLGDPFSFGITKQTISIRETNITIENDFSFIIALFILTAFLKIIKEILEFYFSAKSIAKQ